MEGFEIGITLNPWPMNLDDLKILGLSPSETVSISPISFSCIISGEKSNGDE